MCVRFSAATTADRLLPPRLALRARPLLDRLDALLFTADERGEAGRISLIAFVIRVVSAVIAFVSQVLLARWMGSFEYGIFVLVWTTMIIVGNLACLGFHTSVIRFIPEYRERGMLPELRGILLTSRAVRAGRLDADRRPWRGRHLVFLRLDRELLRRALHPRRDLPADDRALRRAAGHFARQCLGAVGAVADLSDPPGADPRVHGDGADRRLPGRRADRDLCGDRRLLRDHADAAGQRHRSHRPQDPRRSPAGAVRHVVRRLAADLPDRELLLPAHQCRRADGRLLHAARRRRRLFRHGEDAGAGAFRLFRRQGGRRAALCRLHPRRSRRPGGLRPRDRVVDILAVAADGHHRAGAGQADADPVRPGISSRASRCCSCWSSAWSRARRSARPRACSP